MPVSHAIPYEKQILLNQVFGSDDSDDEELQPHIPKEQIQPKVQKREVLSVLDQDIPERLLKKGIVKHVADDDELIEETQWVLNILKKQGVEPMKLMDKIEKVIRSIRTNHFDIPFIIKYRRYLYEPELTENELYKIYDLIQIEWTNFYTNKKGL